MATNAAAHAISVGPSPLRYFTRTRVSAGRSSTSPTPPLPSSSSSSPPPATASAMEVWRTRTSSSLSLIPAYEMPAASRRSRISLTRSFEKSSSTTEPSSASCTVSPFGSVRTLMPSKASTTAFQMTLILSWLSTRSASTLLARNVSRRWMTVTLFDVLASTSASSIAVSPPPTTTTSLPLNRNPSQVAQVLTPPPLKLYSPSAPSHRESAPVARMTACDWMVVSLVATENGRLVTSTDVTRSCSNTAPNCAACFCMSCTSAGPVLSFTPG
mmetsp:Transcript_40310/g.80742  ORF Transcript_40310/g.80742 Transcript_40310/m.80742 type:complete len:271 (+) Transcript_40310:335-1147(+)